MYKKFGEDSRLIDFSKKANDKRTVELADTLLEDLSVNKKHLERKRKILISLLVNLRENFSCGLTTAISRSKPFYRINIERYKQNNKSYGIITDLIDKMKYQNKYVIEHKKGIKYEFTEVSQYYPSNYLNSFIQSLPLDSISFEDEECILLRKKILKNIKKTKRTKTKSFQSQLTQEEFLNVGLEDEGQITKKLVKMLVDYTDTEYTNIIRKDLKEYNQFRIQHTLSLKDLPEEIFKNKKTHDSISKFASTDITKIRPDSNGKYQIPLAKDNLVRIFSTDFDHGGRFYRGFETQLKKELRAYIAINGNPTVELDYSSYHIRMLYHLDKKRCPDDPYMVVEELEDEVRDYYKTMVAACLNCKSENSVLNTMRYFIIKEGLTEEFSSLDNKRLKMGLDTLVHHNRKVAGHFYKEEGLIYHKIDSDIANDILMHFTRRKTPVLALCVHDSFIVPKEHEEELRWAMNKFYRVRLRKLPKIK